MWSDKPDCRASSHVQLEWNTGCCTAGRVIQTYLSLAVIAVRTVEYSTTEVTSTWLLPEMVLRVANMLNYFLQFLTGTHKHVTTIKQEMYHIK